MAVSLGLGILPIASPTFFSSFPDWASMILSSGVVTATISALLLNVFFEVLGSARRRSAEPEPAPDEPEPSGGGG